MEPERDEKKALQQLLTYYNYLRHVMLRDWLFW